MMMMKLLMGSCEEVTALYSESLDGKLSLKEKFTLRFHLSMCKFCKRYTTQVRMIRGWVHQYFGQNESPTAGNSEQLLQTTKERFKKKISALQPPS